MRNPRLKPDLCELCTRHISLTFHHLIPRKVHRRTRFKKHYDSTTLNRGIWVCRDCHKAIHRFHTEMELALSFCHLETLKQSEALMGHIQWQKRQRVRKS